MFQNPKEKLAIKSCFPFQPLLHISHHALPCYFHIGKEVGGIKYKMAEFQVYIAHAQLYNDHWSWYIVNKI